MLKTGHHLSDREIAARYRELGHRGSLGEGFRRRILELVGDAGGLAVADLGCGRGELLADLATRRPARLCGVDFSPERLAAARRRLGPATLLVAGNLNAGIPLASSSLDVVCCTEVIEHLKDPEGFLQEVARVLRPGGQLVVSVPNAAAYQPFLRLGSWIPTPWLRRKLLPYEHPCNTDQPIDTCFEHSEIMDLLDTSGLELEETRGYRYFRYLEVFPLVRSLYRPLASWVEEQGNRRGWQRFAYNLLMRWRKA